MLEIIASELGLPVYNKWMEQLTKDALFYDDLYQKTFKLPKEEQLKMMKKAIARVEKNSRIYQNALEKMETWIEYSYLASYEDPLATIARKKEKMKK